MPGQLDYKEPKPGTSLVLYMSVLGSSPDWRESSIYNVVKACNAAALGIIGGRLHFIRNDMPADLIRAVKILLITPEIRGSKTTR